MFHVWYYYCTWQTLNLPGFRTYANSLLISSSKGILLRLNLLTSFTRSKWLSLALNCFQWRSVVLHSGAYILENLTKNVMSLDKNVVKPHAAGPNWCPIGTQHALNRAINFLSDHIERFEFFSNFLGFYSELSSSTSRENRRLSGTQQ